MITDENQTDSDSEPGTPPSPFKKSTEKGGKQRGEKDEEKEEEDEEYGFEEDDFDVENSACRSVKAYVRKNTIAQGVYGVVHRARNKKTGELVALKKIKMEQSHSGFPITSIREITLLLSLKHDNIVNVKEIVVDDNLADVYMVMELMDNDLKGIMQIKPKPFSTSEVKCLMIQLLRAVEHMHNNWILHRDLKTSNLLFNNKGILKVCDLGMARKYGSPLLPYSPIVVTLWYRSPELLLGAKTYSTAVDVWSAGCIMAELLTSKALFDGRDESSQINKIFKMLGTPTEKTWSGVSKLPHFKNFKFVNQPHCRLRQHLPPLSHTGKPTLTATGMDLLLRLLCYDPQQRISAAEALKHPWFEESPKPQSTDMMPTFPILNQHRRETALRRNAKKNEAHESSVLGKPSAPIGFSLR